MSLDPIDFTHLLLVSHLVSSCTSKEEQQLLNEMSIEELHVSVWRYYFTGFHFVEEVPQVAIFAPNVGHTECSVVPLLLLTELLTHQVLDVLAKLLYCSVDVHSFFYLFG